MTGPDGGTAKIGIIGVGALGLAVAKRLIGSGHIVAGYRRGNLDAFTAAGGIAMPDAAGTAACAEPLILLLPNDAALAEVMTLIAPHLRGDQIILCLGTHKIAAKLSAAAIAQAAGATMLDGEVSGTPAMVAAAQASVMVAGDLAAYERVRPVLDGFASAASHLGAFGNATKMKLITNYLVGVHTLAAAEALLLADRLGLDQRAVVEAISPSAGGSRMFGVRGRMIAERNIPNGDMAGFMRFFDLLREALSERGDTAAPLLDLTERLYRRAIEQGHGGRDIAAVYDSR